MSTRTKDALRRAGRAAAIAAIAGVLLYFNPTVDGPLLLFGMLVNGMAWAAVAFFTVLAYRLARPATMRQ